MAVHPRRRGEHAGRWPLRCMAGGSSPQARGTLDGDLDHQLASRFIPAGAGNTRATCPSASPRTVHPRRRGEHSFARPQSHRAHGSSPQARGTLHCLHALRRYPRFIPAGAGNTICSTSRTGSRAVHPRRRGEHSCAVSGWLFSFGSSPQARGTHLLSVSGVRECRFIPAGAGNTNRAAAARATCTVHPRRRGEHVTIGFAGYSKDGSSPQARGTRHGEVLSGILRRFIPAGAGNTTMRAA